MLPLLLVGMKADLLSLASASSTTSSPSIVAHDMIMAYAQRHNMIYVTCSAYDHNVDRIFATAVCSPTPHIIVITRDACLQFYYAMSVP